MPRDDVLQLVPVRLRELPGAVVVLAQLRIGHRQAELPDLRHVAVEELLARLAVPLALDPPDVHGVLFLAIGFPWNCISGAHQRSSASWTSSRCSSVPFIIVRITSRPWRMWNDSSQQIFFMIRAYGAYEHLRSAFWLMIAAASTSQAMTPDVAPGLRRVVEDVVELRLARDQVLEALRPRLAEVLDDAVDELRVADLVLHLRGKGELPLQRRRAEDPLALGEDPMSSEFPCISMNLISFAR